MIHNKISRDYKNLIKIYASQVGDYYASQTNNKGLRNWWFRKRQHIIGNLVKKYYRGEKVLDIGCGNSVWNKNGIPTIGIDICEAMLKYDKHNIPNFIPLKADISRGLPIKSESVTMVVITEVLEHINSYIYLIEEIRRILKRGGVAIVSVPYNKLPGIWNIIFSLWCKYKWWKDKDEYYFNLCGHMINFNVDKIQRSFNRFTFVELRTIKLLTIFCAVRKE
jgi:ubiquinone/menaquinone biosynthesis C-methylase UbiE